MTPNHINGRDKETLIRRVNTAKGRTHTYHVEVWVALCEETTLETSVDTEHLWLLAEELLVRIYHHLGQFAVRIHLPSRVALACIYLSTSMLEYGAYGVSHIVVSRHNIASLRSGNENASILLGLYACKVA